MHANILHESSKGFQTISIADEMFRKRTIFFTEPVTPESVEKLIAQLMELESQDPGKRITVFINSPGGDVHSGFAAVDTMLGITSPIRTVCTGIAASMGAILFLVGEERIITPHSKVLIHDPSYGGGNLAGVKPLNIKEDLDKLMSIRSDLANFIAERTGKSKKFILSLTKTDCCLSAEKALAMGIATGIRNFVLPDCEDWKPDQQLQTNSINERK